MQFVGDKLIVQWSNESNPCVCCTHQKFRFTIFLTRLILDTKIGQADLKMFITNVFGKQVEFAKIGNKIFKKLDGVNANIMVFRI